MIVVSVDKGRNANDSVGAGTIFNDDGLRPSNRQALRKKSGREIGSTARRDG
jgi:hypothetical protein